VGIFNCIFCSECYDRGLYNCHLLNGWPKGPGSLNSFGNQRIKNVGEERVRMVEVDRATMEKVKTDGLLPACHPLVSADVDNKVKEIDDFRAPYFYTYGPVLGLLDVLAVTTPQASAEITCVTSNPPWAHSRTTWTSSRHSAPC
jgi:hypothetical protein